MEYGLLNKRNKKSVALKAVEISGDLVGEALWVKSKQYYCNDSGKNAEFIYTFPLSEQAAVCDFTAKIGEQFIRGEIKERESAFEEYDEALRNGDSAFLLENVRPNAFQVSLGQINPGEEVEINISYFQEIKNSDAEMRISIPTLLAPRYIPGKPSGEKLGPGEFNPTDRVPDGDFISPPIGETNYQATIKLNLNTLTPISSVASPSHQIIIEPVKENTAIISLAEGDSQMNRDFVLNIKLFGEALPRLIYGKNQQNEYFAYASYTPELPAVEKKQASEYIFLIDISGSMAGEKLKQAANAIQICLRNLSPEDIFNMVAFESEIHKFSKESVNFNQENLDRASTWVRGLRSTGGTEILPAVQFALKESSEYQKIVLLFTDGQVGNEKEIINYVKKRNDNLRLFTLGIDTSVNSHFINQIAEAGNAYAEFVYPGENLEDKVLRHFSRINASFMDSIKFELDNASEKDLAGEIPARLYDLEAYSQVFKLANRPEGKLIIKGNYKQQEISIEIDDIQELESAEVLEKLWAKQKIAELEAYLDNGNPRRSQKIKADIIAISEKYRLISSLTSFLAVYQRENKLSGLPETIVIPVDFPHAWGMFDIHSQDLDIPTFLKRSGITSPAAGAMVVTSQFLVTDSIFETKHQFSNLKFNRPISSDDDFNEEFAPIEEALTYTDKLKPLAAKQNFDGSFGSFDANIDSKIQDTARAIINFANNASNISIFRNQLKKAIDYLITMEAEIMGDEDLLKIVCEALELARSRKIIRNDNQQQIEFTAKIKSKLEDTSRMWDRCKNSSD